MSTILKISGNIALFLFLLVNMSCERNIDNSNNNGDNDENSEFFEGTDDYEWNSSTVTSIYLDGNDITVSDTGVVYSKNKLMIQRGGEYLITGILENGQIIVSSSDTSIVKLILDNVNIGCDDNSVIYIEESERTIIILADSSNNFISDGSSYSSEEMNAAIFSKSDLSISGNGKLTVDGNYKDAIAGKDGLIINSGNFEINAVDDGIRGKDYLVIKSGTFSINSGGDAVISDNENTGYGNIEIYSGEFNISSRGDGFYAHNELYLEDGTYDIHCTGSLVSGKALKSDNKIVIGGGNYKIESVDDAVHSDLDILVKAGNFNITTKDDGFHAEDELTVEYAEILINNSYEGLEAKTLTIKDGDITLYSSDDGLNAASGDGASQAGPMMTGGGNNNLYIEGGTIAVYAFGDGIDINGSVEMSGGTLIVHGPTANNNGALDYDGSFILSGGKIIAAGSSGMAMAPGSSSSVYSVLINFTTTYSANTLFNLQDESGKEVITFKPAHNFQSVEVSSPDLSKGSTYNIYTGGSTTGSESEGVYNGGTYTPGSLYKTFTISSVTTAIGSSSFGGDPGGGRPH